MKRERQNKLPILMSLVTETAMQKSINENLVSHIFKSSIRENASDLEIYEFLVSRFAQDVNKSHRAVLGEGRFDRRSNHFYSPDFPNGNGHT